MEFFFAARVIISHFAAGQLQLLMARLASGM